MTIAESQEIHKHLLTPAPGESEAQMWKRAWMFTNNVCYDTRDQFAMIKKTGGRVCGPGVDCDKIIERAAPHRIYDLVRSAGSTSAAPIFDYTGHEGHPGDFADPLPYGAEPIPVPPPVVQPYPSESPDGGWWGQVADVEIAKRYAVVHRPYPSDQKSLRWVGRIAYDIRDGMTKEDSLAKHLRELEQELGL